jgi:glycine cleavage system transcriptional repressor
LKDVAQPGSVPDPADSAPLRNRFTMPQLVVSAVGHDHPGLVDQLTELLSRYHANIADSRMVNLHGQFAVVMLIDIPEPHVASIQQELPVEAEKLGLTATIAATGAAGDRGTPSPGVPLRIRTFAMDQAGLVHRIAHALHQHGVNIEDLTTKLEHGPHSGTPLFSMDMVVTVPAEVPLKKVREALEALCADLNCDLDIDRA